MPWYYTSTWNEVTFGFVFRMWALAKPEMVMPIGCKCTEATLRQMDGTPKRHRGTAPCLAFALRRFSTWVPQTATTSRWRFMTGLPRRRLSLGSISWKVEVPLRFRRTTLAGKHANIFSARHLAAFSQLFCYGKHRLMSARASTPTPLQSGGAQHGKIKFIAQTMSYA